MSLRTALSRAFGRAEFIDKAGVKLPANRNCPEEADTLAYLEARLSKRHRAQMESHLAGCDNCRELIALFAHPSEEEAGAGASVTESEIRAQTANVLLLIEQDELNGRAVSGRAARSANAKAGFYLPYPAVASIAVAVCVIVITLVFWMTREPSPQSIASQSLAQAMRERRRAPVRISGDLPYSEHFVTRGEGDADDLQLRRTLDQLENAGAENATPEARHAIARLHLGFNRPDNTEQALRILLELTARGNESAELLNDLGVAQFELGHYEDAIESFARALNKSPDYGEALFNKAYAEERAGRTDDAIRDWQQFSINTPDGLWKDEAQRRLASLQRPLSVLRANHAVG